MPMTCRRLLAALAASGACLLGAAPAPAQGFSPDQQAALEGAIHDYLVAHPEVIVEALSAYQQQQAEAEQQQQQQQIAARHDEIFNAPGAPVLGNADGDVTVVEFFDYQCPYCKHVVGDVFQLAADDPGVRIVFRDFPILSPVSVVAAKAALAARQQGRYVEYHNKLLSHEGTLTEDDVFSIAASVGLDVDQLRSDMEQPEIEQELQQNIALATEIGVRGTPAFIIGDQIIPGAVSLQTLEQLVNAQRAG